jgi:urease accessory protein
LALLAALQYGDSAYPAGGYAHSWGLETAAALGDVRDATALAGACRSLLRHQAGPTDAVAAAAGCRAALARDLAAFGAVDRRLSVTRPARESREASIRVGRRLVETAARAEGDPWLMALREAVRAGQTPGNAAPVLGAVAGLAGVSSEGAASLALWIVANGCLSAALRLLRITHDDVQAILTGLRGEVAALAAEAARVDPLTMAGSAPGLDLWSMLHETATVRLFAS